MNTHQYKCAGCGAVECYTTTVRSGGPRGPAFLPDVGGFLRTARFEIVACAHCGLTRFYAEQCAREKLPRAARWKAI